jgi:hypothetical protein
VTILAYALLALGSLICIQNSYASFIRHPLYRRAGGAPDEYHHVSPVPILGSLFVGLGLVWLAPGGWLLVAGVVLAALDTGGLHWILPVLCIELIRARRGRASDK